MRGADAVTGRIGGEDSVWWGIGVTFLLTHSDTAGHQPDHTPYLSDDGDSANHAQHWSAVGMRGADTVTGPRPESSGFN